MKTLLPEIDSPDKRFHAGNPATGEQGTRVTDTWLNDVQDHVRDVQAEAHYVLLKAGFKPVENQQTQLYDAIVKIIDDNRQKASTTGKGEVQLYSGYDSDSEEMAATPKAIKLLKAFIDALTRNLTNYIPNSKKSSDVNSASADTVATSAAVKKAYDKAESKWTAQAATETTAGILPISHKTDGTDKNKFASEYAVGEAAKKGVPIGAVVSFPRAVTNPVGFLRADGSTFSQQTFPDLYRTLGDSNQLPDLTRSDTGMTAYFAVDNIPAGWIAFDSIRTTVTQQNYPELYRHLVGKYGSIAAVPKAEDRFIRNAGNGLQVGQTQEDDLKRHVHRVPIDYDSWFDDSSQGRNNSYFDYTTFTHSSDLWSVNYYDDRDGDNGFVSPKNTSQMATGGDETRPKSLVLKLCIKALNSFDDVIFWIKSHGEVTNAGTLDAGRLAQGLQDKADRNHTHTVSQITDFNQATSQIINAAITYQRIGNVEIRKYPDGTMIQTGLIVFTRGDTTVHTDLVLPIAYVDKEYRCFITERYESRASGKGQYNWVFMQAKTNTTATVTSWYLGSADWMTIGRWK
ncbi:tail fiber protein [Haemophilus influenzae]|uniref:phage tail protein n=1 Tax=Haemophilus influenzae TaxID=727 RepID=UPI00045968DF|nr:phage tail protein [Haemophilus influenzae]KAI98203.1 tail fiber protein [Haemophilus influenzae]KAI98961.1 tail fiber protein [Haemophilus influenzae]KAJ00642.1 tail fiber protein [Haemophilus influenzae]